mmetsp:Transcript_18538/g.47125  ORF Transcript_18538/g.47125 Transcript_18538/m.47125 type:complete len:204 (+) Transcript_18538:1132-1743(+)
MGVCVRLDHKRRRSRALPLPLELWRCPAAPRPPHHSADHFCPRHLGLGVCVPLEQVGVAAAAHHPQKTLHRVLLLPLLHVPPDPGHCAAVVLLSHVRHHGGLPHRTAAMPRNRQARLPARPAYPRANRGSTDRQPVLVAPRVVPSVFWPCTLLCHVLARADHAAPHPHRGCLQGSLAHRVLVRAGSHVQPRLGGVFFLSGVGM